MSTQEIDAQRNTRGVFNADNETAGWYAISREGINMITYEQGKFSFSMKDSVNRLYTARGFAQRVTELMKRGY